MRFGALLRALGLPVPAGRMLDVAAALQHVELGRRTDFYFTLQALLVQRHQDLPIFDEDTELVEFSPKGEYQKTLEVAARNVAAMMEA